MRSADPSALVRSRLETLVRDGPEIGLQVAAYRQGRLVIDAWAGLADPSTGRAVDGDTVFMLSSTGKGVAATCMHICAERHRLSLDMPIAAVWPEFAAQGKADATLRHALCHQTGVPQAPAGYTPDWLPDWDRMCRGIAALPPLHRPGSCTAYHSLTFGFIIGEVVRRVDGRSIDRFLQDEVCAPLAVDGAWFGVPRDELPRVARLVDGPPAQPSHLARMVGEPAGCEIARVFNRGDILQACIPGSGGVFSARGLARHYAALAGGGILDGVRILSPSALARATELQSREPDVIYQARIRRGLGYRLGPDAGPFASRTAFGHVGGGGSFGYADPERGLAIGFAKNYFVYRTAIASPGQRTIPSVGRQVAAAVFEALG